MTCVCTSTATCTQCRTKCTCTGVTDLDRIPVLCEYCTRRTRRVVPANQGAEYSKEYTQMSKAPDVQPRLFKANVKLSPQDINGVRPIQDVVDKRPEVLNSRTYYHDAEQVWVTLTEHDDRPAECLVSGSVTDEQRAIAGLITLAFKNGASLDTVTTYLPRPGRDTFVSFLVRALYTFRMTLEGREVVAKRDIADVFEEGNR